MHLQVTSLDMRYSFETKTTVNVLRAVLPNGRHLEFEVSEEEIQTMLALDQMEVPFDAQYREPKPSAYQLVSEPLEDTHEETDESPVQLGVVERNVSIPQQRRSRYVESDERGNPVVEPRAVPVPDDVDDDTGARSI